MPVWFDGLFDGVYLMTCLGASRNFVSAVFHSVGLIRSGVLCRLYGSIVFLFAKDDKLSGISVYQRSC